MGVRLKKWTIGVNRHQTLALTQSQCCRLHSSVLQTQCCRSQLSERVTDQKHGIDYGRAEGLPQRVSKNRRQGDREGQSRNNERSGRAGRLGVQRMLRLRSQALTGQRASCDNSFEADARLLRRAKVGCQLTNCGQSLSLAPLLRRPASTNIWAASGTLSCRMHVRDDDLNRAGIAGGSES